MSSDVRIKSGPAATTESQQTLDEAQRRQDKSANQTQKAAETSSAALAEAASLVRRLYDDFMGESGEDRKPQDGLPQLPAPLGPLDLQALMKALSNEVRRQACKDGLVSLEVRAKEQSDTNKKQLEELGKQIEELQKKNALSGIMKFFQILGAIVGAIASALTITAGVLTGNPLLITAGVICGVMTADSILSMASDGEYSISAAVAAIAKECGADDETANWIALSMQVAIMITSTALSLGAAFGSSAGQAANMSAHAAKLVFDVSLKVQPTMNIISATMSVSQGILSIANTVLQNNADKCKISAKELDAVLERIRAAIDAEQSMVKNEMERITSLMEKVQDLVQSCVQAQKKIMAASPAMA